MADGNDLPGPGDDQDVCSFFATLLNQRRSMERLLNWLRQTQATTCTDSSCFDEISGLPRDARDPGLLGSDNSMPGFEALPLVLMVVVSLLTIYAMNISRGRNRESINTDKGGNSRNSGRDDDHDRDRRRDNDDDDHMPVL